MLDREKPFTEVFGRLPLKYMQGGQGFDTSGKPLGAVNDQGELEHAGSKSQTPSQEAVPAGEGETLRARYERVVGKKAPPAMKAETMQARIDEAQGEAD